MFTAKYLLIIIIIIVAFLRLYNINHNQITCQPKKSLKQLRFPLDKLWTMIYSIDMMMGGMSRNNRKKVEVEK